jgi:phosphate-selective porin
MTARFHKFPFGRTGRVGRFEAIAKHRSRTFADALKPWRLGLFGLALVVLGATASTNAAAGMTLSLYVDSVTKQVYTDPGPNRVPLGRFAQVDEATAAPVASAPQAGASAPPAVSAVSGAAVAAAVAAAAPAVAAAPVAAPVAEKPVAKTKWYDALSIRGYTQFRYNQLLDRDLDSYRHHADRSWSDDQSFLIRRARLVLSGDVSEHLYVYLQPDFAVTPPGSSQTHFVQLRDAYADYAFDKAKEFRVRFGQSKIPYGFENLQSSQNRLPLDRHDAFNSCCKDERDIGVFMYWAPAHIRALFKAINDRGLKGSGDYGVVGFGIYNGQGANRFEANDQVHMVARVSYPWQFANGQIVEMGTQVQHGRFMPTVDNRIVLDGPSDGLEESRFGFSAVLYPQPFGLQTEWNWGRGPALSADQSRVEVKPLNGGYVQAMYRYPSAYGILFPFVRWQHYQGAMKFERNAPRNDMTETELGVEWQIRPEFEFTTMYVMSDRTNVLVAPYEQMSGDVLRFQVQWNY